MSNLQGVCSKLDHARHLLATMAKQRHKWEEKVKLTRSRIDSLPGHALLCSAAVCYLTRVPPSKHKALLSAWLGYCEGTISLGNVIEERGGLQAAQVCLLCCVTVISTIICHDSTIRMSTCSRLLGSNYQLLLYDFVCILNFC